MFCIFEARWQSCFYNKCCCLHSPFTQSNDWKFCCWYSKRIGELNKLSENVFIGRKKFACDIVHDYSLYCSCQESYNDTVHVRTLFTSRILQTHCSRHYAHHNTVHVTIHVTVRGRTLFTSLFTYCRSIFTVKIVSALITTLFTQFWPQKLLVHFSWHCGGNLDC